MTIRFLRCFAVFRRLEAQLDEARTEVAIARDRALRAENEADRNFGLYETAYKGHIEAMKMLNNVSVQVATGCAPPHPEVWSLPAKRQRPLDFDPIEPGRSFATDTVRKTVQQFYADLEEFQNPKSE